MNLKIKNRELLISKKGITLVALVVTIIVLLILAGVVIMSLMGDNNIITNALNSIEDNKKAEFKEEIELVVTDVITNKKGNNLSTPLKTLIELELDNQIEKR